MTGHELRAIRLRLDMTAEAFGRALGYEGPHVRINVYQMESGARAIPRKTAIIAAMYAKRGAVPRELR